MGFWSASCRISIRFFSPPENPSFRYRLEKSLRDVGQLHRGLDRLAELLERDRLQALALAVRVENSSQVLGDRDTRHRHRILKGHEQPHPGPLVRRSRGHVLTLEQDLALGHLEPG